MVKSYSAPCGACGKPADAPAARILVRLVSKDNVVEQRLRLPICPECHATGEQNPGGLLVALGRRWLDRGAG